VGEYAAAVVIVAVAVALRIALDQMVPERFVLASFLPAVLIAAYLLDLGASILVLVLSALLAATWIGPPPGAHEITYYLAGFALCMVIGALAIYFVRGMKLSHRRSLQHEEQLALINRELKHRIKNLFAIAGAVCQQTMKSGKPPDEMARAVMGRLSAVANAQDLLSVASSTGANLSELIEALVRTVAPDPSRLRVSGDPIHLPAEATTPFALILHELATNALKYGAWSHTGYVATAWTIEAEELSFEWREHDGPAIAPPLREGLGSALIKSGLPTARVEHALKPDGLLCRIRLPLTKIPDAGVKASTG
jgi:two-component sensor histidine kinase